MRSQIPKFRLPDKVIDEECNYILDLGVEFRGGRPIEQPEEAAGRRLGRDVRRLRRAARARTRYSGPQGSGEEHPHRHRLALVGLVRPRHEHRQARHRARRRQHRDGLLPLLAPPRRRGREGDRALRLRGDEGVAVGKRRRDARGHPDPQFPRAEGIHPPGRQAHRRHLREGEGRVRRQGPPQAGDRPASRTSISNATTCWSRSARRTRSRGSSATSGSNSTSGTCRRSIRRPSCRPIRRSSSAAMRRSARRTSSGRWRTATRPPSRSTSSSTARTSTIVPLPAVEVVQPEDGHPRVELRQRHRERQALPRADARQRHRAEGHPHRGRARLRRQARLRRGAALPELRRADRVHRAALHRVRRLRRHLPDGLHHLHAERRGSGSAHAPEGAGDEPDAGPLRRRQSQDRPRDGEGRGRVPALRAVRRALPDRRLGHAEIPDRNDASGTACRSRA